MASFRQRAVIQLTASLKMIDYMLSTGDVWFATMEEIAAYVNKLAAEGQYDPRVDQLPYHTEPPPTKVEGFSGLERLRRTVEIFSD